MSYKTVSIIKVFLKGVSWIINTPYLSIPLSVFVFYIGLKIFKKGITVKSSEDYSNIKALSASISLFSLSIMLIINAVRILIH